MRVGVTGHRTYDHPQLIAHRIADAVGDLASRAGVPLELWTSLAEGADRAAAHAVLEAGGTIVAVLPLCADDYRGDFADAASRDEFESLLARSTAVTVTGGDGSGDRAAAYERAGRMVVESVEALIAVWDGRPSRGRGGTAEIVAAGRERGLDVIVIPVTRDDAPA
jgi:hypothetical protein